MLQPFLVENTDYTPDEIVRLVRERRSLKLSDAVIQRLTTCRAFLEAKLEEPGASYYGINTGFGSLYNVNISKSEITTLQSKLVSSHACGVGDQIPDEITRLILLLKILNLAKGHSGVRVALVDGLVALYNHDILPCIYEIGSLGASGDLVPLAHLSLALLGKGEVMHRGEKMPCSQAFEKCALKALEMHSKEGLALINGTQFSGAYLVYAVTEAHRLFRMSNLVAAISVDGFNGNLSPFDPLIQSVRPFAGQQVSAAQVMTFLDGSEIAAQENKELQDPYSFRCVPQVHGASYEAITHVAAIVQTEINAVTDNPLLFPEDDRIISGGNFHAQPIALGADYLALALSELGNISERRTYQLVSGRRGLPDYLVQDAGLQSGLMILQYTAAALVNQNKQLCSPVSVDSITSSKGQEDHVSMSANSVTKLWRVVQNCWRLLAIEFMTGMQAIDYRAPLCTSEHISELKKRYRDIVPFLEEDRVLHQDLDRTISFIKAIK